MSRLAVIAAAALVSSACWNPLASTVPIKKASTIHLEARIVSESGCVVVEIAMKGSSPRRPPEICGTKGQIASVSSSN